MRTLKPLFHSATLLFLLAGLARSSALHGAHAAQPNTLTDSEKQAGWKLLFDGQTLQGWRLYKQPTPPAEGWRVENGELRKLHGVKGGDIITSAAFLDFELTWEWWIAPAGNNGVKYLVSEERQSAPGHEYQMIDDAKHPDALRGSKRMTAAFYDVLPPSPNKPTRPPGQWNQSRIRVKGQLVEHWLNGAKVLEYELESPAVQAAIGQSKFKDSPGFGKKIRGPIMLTDHNDEARFRNIKIRELNP